MKATKLILTTAIIAALSGLYGCSEGDDADVSIEDNSTSTTNGGTTGGTTGGSTSTVSQNCPSWSSAKNIDAEGNDVCALPPTILVSRVLTSDIVWYMEGRVTVGNGNGLMSPAEGVLENTTAVVNATLTIEPGTQIKAATGTFANLLITRGSRIEASGTVTDPIVFSSDDDGYDGAGEWGGLIIHGYGLHNDADYACGGGTCQNVDSEGESGFSGGNTANDNSGTLRYVVITEGGYEFAPGDEINGLSLVAVGSGTTIDYLQVNSNSDDGVEFYGGNVNAKHLVLTGNLDDSIDWDEGYQGNMQYVIVKQSADSEGNTIEADTEGSLAFLSIPTIANATLIGDGAVDTLMVFKKTSGGFLHHSVVTSATGSLVTDCIDSTAGALSDNSSIAELVFTNVVGDCATSGDADLIAAPIADVMLDSDYAAQASEAQTATVGTLNIAAIKAAYSVSVATTSFFDATDYAGAIDPTAAGADNWYEGWIVEGSL